MAKKKKSKFSGRTGNDAKRQKKAGTSYGYLKLPKNVNVYSPTPGSKEKFDILPYVVTTDKHPDLSEGFPKAGEEWYKRPFKVHKAIGADSETYVCLTTENKKCPICEYYKTQLKEGVDKEELKPIKVKDRVLYVTVPRGVKKLDEEIHILDMSWWLFQENLNDELEEEEDYERFPDISKDGLTLKVRWKKDSYQGNKFAKAGRIDFEDRKKGIASDLLDNIPDLDSILTILSYKELEAKFLELGEDDEEEEKTTKKRKKKSNKSSEKKKKKEEVKLTWDDLLNMKLKELNDVCPVTIDMEAYRKKLTTLRRLIAKELDIEAPAKTTTKKKTSKKETKEELTCPSDLKFGVDTDTKKACKKCKIWNECDDKKEGGK